MAIDGSTIAAILTGILALVGAVTTAWMSGLNQQRVDARRSRKALARSSAPLLIASWDLHNWLFDILEETAYSPKRCAAYGDGWPSDFTSYLFGQYFAGVHIIRETTQFFAHIQGGRAGQLKKLLWKIQDEFVSMHYERRENTSLRWSERRILEVQEAMTKAEGSDGSLRAMRWIEFREKYTEDTAFREVFKPCEDEFQKIIYRRFKYLYSTNEEWKDEGNPSTKPNDKITEIEKKRRHDEEKEIEEERGKDPANIVVVIPDHRARRLQHLLSDLVELLDEESGMKFNRPVRRCSMVVSKRALAFGTAPNFVEISTDHVRIPCDCQDPDHDKTGCNWKRKDFEHRQLKDGNGNAFGGGGASHWEPQRSSFVPDESKFRRKATDNADQC
ncbi:hypothetical protein QBC41DRAFT_383652 [Cercophora samala]|uniref:Uncharacterized protein n=1 Tax=Cercophora samala TaxID=330535 RepID=A0AA40D4P4_9PEZI|nr:hypothetical protein QBC41DRAFT_383652 [Cercophora samala]